MRVQLGAFFVLELPARATAGYQWRIAREPRVAILRKEQILPAGSVPGGPSIQEFEFEAIHPGSGELVMELRRPWESMPIEEYELTVFVSSVS